MTTRNDELEDFKRRIDLTAFAAAEGYELDPKSSSRNSAVMVSGGDKIIVAIDPRDQHFVYFTIGGDERDCGSIIDFVLNRQGGTLGHARKVLRPWLGQASDPPRPAPVARLEPINRDVVQVRARLAEMQPAPHHPYLAGDRSIPREILEYPIFENRIRMDARGNAVFPHWNRDGLCGYELKNRDFAGFSPGGFKGLWCSRPTDEDRRLVISEGAIDGLSWGAIKGVERTRFVSLSGQMSPEQPALLQSAMQRMPQGSQVIAATDADEAGAKIAERVEALFREISPAECVFVSDPPSDPFKDWNDALRGPVANSGPS